MQIEDLPPNRPNFKLVVILFGATILVVAVLAVIMIRYKGKNMVPNAATKTNTSQLRLPRSPALTAHPSARPGTDVYFAAA